MEELPKTLQVGAWTFRLCESISDVTYESEDGNTRVIIDDDGFSVFVAEHTSYCGGAGFDLEALEKIVEISKALNFHKPKR